jgi:hypothetical protein
LAASSQQSAACLLCGNKAGTLTVAILGSSTVDADDIDPASCRLEGVAAMPVGQGVSDEATGDGTTDCTCNTLGGDGWADLLLKFPAQEVAATLAQPNVGDTLTLTLTGAYNDGMPFSASDCVVVVAGDPTPLQTSVTLGLPNPNPFNPTTQISYSVPTTQHVRLAIYDVAGRLVQSLVSEVKGPGEHVAVWNASRLASGVYFYRLQTANETIVRRATLLK